MDDLIKEVTKRTGLPEAQARAAAEAVISFLKQHMPEPAAGMLTQYMGAQPAGVVGGAKEAVEGLLKKF